MTNRHHRRNGRTTPRGARPPARPGGDRRGRGDRRSHRPRSDELPLLADARAALAESTPLPLLSLASALVEATTPHQLDSFPGYQTERPDAGDLFASFTDPDHLPLGAVALAALPLLADRALADRIQDALDPRVLVAGPPWLATIDRIRITGTLVQTEELGDGDNIMVGWSWPGGHQATAVIYVDHNLGTLVKDAFVFDRPIDEVARLYRGMSDTDVGLAPIDPADARARVEGALERAEMTVPPFESDTWPLCRPLVQWVLGHLPAGGTGYVRPEWSEPEREALLDRFLASPQARVRDLIPAEVRELADPIVWFACDWGPGDPLRWSPVSVELILADWYPRKVFGLPPRIMDRLPDVLEGFVRFAHAAHGVSAGATAETVDAVAHWSADFRAAIARPGRSPEANAVRLARLAAGLDPDALESYADDGLDPDEADYLAARGPARPRPGPGLSDEDDDEDDDLAFATLLAEVEEQLIQRAGGRAAYDALDDLPLPDRPFDWSHIPREQRELTALALKHLDGWATELYDGEIRTIGRAVLAAVVAADPTIFGRTARADALAAAVLCWVTTPLASAVARAPGGPVWAVTSRKQLAAATGLSLSMLSTRVRKVANAAAGADLHRPSLLHSHERRLIVFSRDDFAAWRADRA